MRPLSSLPTSAAAGVRVVLSDIDDTITTDGVLSAAAYEALERLHAAGFLVIPVTGRPAGWCDHIARMWPVDAVVGENGAFYFRYDRAARTMLERFWVDGAQRELNRQRLAGLKHRILDQVPGAATASDQPYRLADLAIDFCEDVEPLPEAEIDRIVSLFEEAGAQAKVSSIHVNGWFGDYDKLSMTRVLLAQEFGIDEAMADTCVIYAGDSPNDEPMFEAFPLSVGVANIQALAHRLRTKPAYVTRGHSGEGFVELAALLLEARGAAGGRT
ncbi:HAD-IIB family hydrolase [Microvirga pudoricolor]|uniref:HAD-IIB family hydrolase n=1 Tax=Microvirga pudoricolor TaxID=2778729 RepID=UPI00194FBB3F|nr:HAD-IIB family hydrolase [Microvirga pudoricolor]